MRKKKFVIPLLAIAVLGLAACNTTENPSSSAPASSEPASSEPASSEPDTRGVTITNKEDLQKTWYVADGSRTLALTLDPATNIISAIQSGLVTSSSSNTAVVTAQGTGLIPVAPGSATITVTYGDYGSDTVTVTVSEAPATKINTIDAVDESVRVVGKVTAVASTGVVVDDGTGGIYIYGGSGVEVGDSVEVSGTTGAYHGAYQLASGAVITKIDALDIATTIENPTKLTAANVNSTLDSSNGSTNYHLKPVTFLGTAFMSGSYQAIQVEDDEDTYLIEPTGWSGDWKTGSVYQLTGYVAAYYTTYKYSAFYISELKEMTTIEMESFTITSPNEGDVAYQAVPIQLSVEPTPVFATETDVTWAVTTANAGTITEAGVFTASESFTGKAVVTATSKTASTVTSTITLDVQSRGAPITGVKLNRTSVTNLHAGRTWDLKATVTSSAAEGEFSLTAVDWTTSDASIATVNSSGRVTGVKEGEVTITATTQNVDSTGKKLTATCKVSVVDIYNTADTRYSADDFGDYIKGDNNDSSSTTYSGGTVYLKGVVQSYSWSENYGNGTIYLHSEKGYTVELYRFKFAEGVTQPAADLVGHEIEAEGTAQNYYGTYELGTGCLVTKYSEAPVTGYFTLGADDVSVEAGKTATVEATYKASATTTAFTVETGDSKVATAAAATVAGGKATITVTAVSTVYAETTLTVKSGSDWSVTIPLYVLPEGASRTSVDTFADEFTLASDKETATLTSGDVTLTLTKAGSSSDIRTSDSDHLRIYKNAKFSVAIANATISQIVFNCTSSTYATNLSKATFPTGVTAAVSGSVVTVTVTGDLSSVEFDNSYNQTRISSVVVLSKAAAAAA